MPINQSGPQSISEQNRETGETCIESGLEVEVVGDKDTIVMDVYHLSV